MSRGVRSFSPKAMEEMKNMCGIFGIECSGVIWLQAEKCLGQARLARSLGVLFTALEDENKIKRRKGCQSALKQATSWKVALPASVAQKVGKAITELF